MHEYLSNLSFGEGFILCVGVAFILNLVFFCGLAFVIGCSATEGLPKQIK